MKGIVKWFDPKRGYGFISGEDGVKYFAHYSSIEMEGYKMLGAGQKVTFEPEMDAKGRSSATHIMPLIE